MSSQTIIKVYPIVKPQTEFIMALAKTLQAVKFLNALDKAKFTKKRRKQIIKLYSLMVAECTFTLVKCEDTHFEDIPYSQRLKAKILVEITKEVRKLFDYFVENNQITIDESIIVKSLKKDNTKRKQAIIKLADKMVSRNDISSEKLEYVIKTKSLEKKHELLLNYSKIYKTLYSIIDQNSLSERIFIISNYLRYRNSKI